MYLGISTFALLAACARQSTGPMDSEIRSGSGSLALSISGAIKADASIDGVAWYARDEMTLMGTGAFVQSYVVDLSVTHGVKAHLVWAQFRSAPQAGDTLILNLLFNIYDSTDSDPLLLHGVTGQYPSSTSDSSWASVTMPYRYSQIDLLLPSVPARREALRFGSSRSFDMPSPYGRYFIARTGDAIVEITKSEGTNPMRISGRIRGRLTDALGDAVTLDSAAFSIVVPMYDRPLIQ